MRPKALGRNSLNDCENAYIAGIIDGEGTIGIYKGGMQYSYYLRVIVTNTCFPLMEWLHLRIGGSFVPHGRGTELHAQAWEIVLLQTRAAQVIRGCLPYLIVKRPQAELGLRFVEDFVSYRGAHAPTNEELARRRHYYEESLKLNGGVRRGRPRKRRE